MVLTRTLFLSIPSAENRSIRDLLEPYAGKLASTVLRGRVGGNTDLLPDIMRVLRVGQFLNGIVLSA